MKFHVPINIVRCILGVTQNSAQSISAVVSIVSRFKRLQGWHEKAFRRVLRGSRGGGGAPGVQETHLKAFQCHVYGIFVLLTLLLWYLEETFSLDTQYDRPCILSHYFSQYRHQVCIADFFRSIENIWKPNQSDEFCNPTRWFFRQKNHNDIKFLKLLKWNPYLCWSYPVWLPATTFELFQA